MSATVNNNEAFSSSTSASNNADQRTHDDSDKQKVDVSFDHNRGGVHSLLLLRSSIDGSCEMRTDQMSNISLAFIRFMKEPIDDGTSYDVDVSTDYQFSDTLLGQYKHMVNNQGFMVE
ncbi:hypothetical protein ACTFIW_008742 [Dictyostelium discoideum]